MPNVFRQRFNHFKQVMDLDPNLDCPAFTDSFRFPAALGISCVGAVRSS